MTTRQDMREEKNFMGGEGLVSLCGWFFEQFTGPWLLTLEAKVPTHPMFLWLYPHVPWQDGCCLQREKSIPQEQENKKYIPMLKICPELPICCFYTVTVLWVFKAQNLTAFSISILARTLVKMFKLQNFFFGPPTSYAKLISDDNALFLRGTSSLPGCPSLSFTLLESMCQNT